MDSAITTKTVPSYYPQLPPERELEREKREHIARQLCRVGTHISRMGEEYIATCWIPNVCHMVLVTTSFSKADAFTIDHLEH